MFQKLALSLHSLSSIGLSYGVTVTQLILVQSFQVRILVAQLKWMFNEM